MSRPTDIETRLRTSLATRSRNAPPGGPLAERILAELDAPSGLLRPRGGWRTWTFPLLAAAAVAAVVAALVGVSHLHSVGSSTPAGSLHKSAPLPPAPVAPTVTATVTPTVTPTTAPTAATPVPRPPGADFSAVDLTFDSTTSGWALGSRWCGAARCTALYRTTDGRTWKPMGRVPFHVAGVEACADRCVDDLRFADDSHGYAFGPTALFMTSDGGAHWAAQPGGALALETHGGVAIRIVDHGTGCPGPCDVRAERSALGTNTWTSTPLQPQGSFIGAVRFDRSAWDAYVLMMRDPAGGAPIATSTLFASTDAGATWTRRPSEPCPQAGAEVDSVAVAASPGTVTVLCRQRAGGTLRVAVSTDAGRTFHAASGVIPGSPSGLVGNPGTELVAYGDDGAYRSTDAGASWQRIGQLRGTVSFLGFESSTVGRALTDGGRSVWTTHDGGATWQRVVLR